MGPVTLHSSTQPTITYLIFYIRYLQKSQFFKEHILIPKGFLYSTIWPCEIFLIDGFATCLDE